MTESQKTPDRLDLPFADPLLDRLFPPPASGVQWGLERTEKALASLGDPHLSYPTVHVGGTNGQGSVTDCRRDPAPRGSPDRLLYLAPSVLLP